MTPFFPVFLYMMGKFCVCTAVVLVYNNNKATSEVFQVFLNELKKASEALRLIRLTFYGTLVLKSKVTQLSNNQHPKWSQPATTLKKTHTRMSRKSLPKDRKNKTETLSPHIKRIGTPYDLLLFFLNFPDLSDI